MSLSYTLRENPRARHINITVRRDGSVWVTKPRRVAMRDVEAFIGKCEQWIERTRSKMSKLPKTSRIETPKRQYHLYKDVARDSVARRVDRINSTYHFSYKGIVIRNQRSRWGSCSHTGILSFNYRILFLPEHLADYIVAHELCHLREMNHSKQFWKLVSMKIPDHLEFRKQLRRLERGLLS